MLEYCGSMQFVGCYERPSLCQLRVYKERSGQRPSLVVVSADPRNVGESPFERPEMLQRVVCGKLGLDRQCLWWVEHLAPEPGYEGHPMGTNRFRVVVFGTDGKTPGVRVLDRVPRTLTEVERMAGGPLAPLQTFRGTPIGGPR